jgi:four helix bundle protein
VSDFKKLDVWAKAHALTLNTFAVATRIRGADYASIRNQMLRASASIPTNIVEGAGQRTGKEFGRFLSISLNSASELEYHLILAHDLGAIKRNDFESLSAQTIEVRKMLYGLRSRVASRAARPNATTSSPHT